MAVPEDILDPLIDEIKDTIKEIRNTKDLEKRKTQSETLKNLCHSVGVFFDFMNDSMFADGLPDLEENPFLDEKE